jgi:sec-independent protein translocase protein TatC
MIDTREIKERHIALMDHLAELRTRIIRSCIYVLVGSIGGWILYDHIFHLLSAPVMPSLEKHGASYLLTEVTEGFVIKMQVSVLAGIIFALPLATLEGWRFIAPGLTHAERRAVGLIAPLSILLFAAGIGLGYLILPVGIGWLVSQSPPGATLMPSVKQTLLFVMKMCLAFGVVFQMPVVLMFFARIGLLTSAMLRSYWRHALVAIGIVAGIVTPSSDAFSMLMMAVPMAGLYALSIVLVRAVEKRA